VIRIGKQFRFEAAHVLPNHHGKCSRPHGHSYLVEVVVAGMDAQHTDGASDEGMLVDFGDLSAIWREVEDQLDHRNLNEQLPPAYHPTTAENIARFLLDVFQAHVHGVYLPRVVWVEKVRVWETATGWAEA
jgi:6-pyruvoyltetrahydropterin/6-carboxytetrahydropterin synthase